MIKEAILSVVITLYYGTNDVISVYSVDIPAPNIESCEKMKREITASILVEQPDEMEGMQYRFKRFCNEK